MEDIDLFALNEKINQDGENLERRAFSTLTIKRSYFIKKLMPLNSRFGKCVLAILYEEPGSVPFKTFLPRRVTEFLSADLIAKINSADAKYTVAYLGQSSPSAATTRSRALIKFDVV